MVLFLLTALHFCVDGVCAAVMVAYAVEEPFFEPIIFHFGLYNLIAFGGQFLAGWLLDRRPEGTPPAFLFSLAALVLGAGAAPHILAQTVSLGLGNCVFHAAAGRLVLLRSAAFGPPGVFVSGGAVGLGLGLGQLVGWGPFLAADALGTALTLRLLAREKAESGARPDEGETAAWGMSPCDTGAGLAKSAPRGADDSAAAGPRCKAEDSPGAMLFFCALLLLACVVLRGFGGKSAANDGMLFPCVLAAGKALGGLCCDRIGFRRTVLAVFLLGFFALQGAGPIFPLLFALSLNMTMPLTLRLAHWCHPTRPGLMFGLAAGCLLPGVFFAGALTIPRPAMVVLQFLTLVFARRLMGRAYGQAGGPFASPAFALCDGGEKEGPLP